MNKNCQFISVEDIWKNKIRITIPDIQRGLVWNAAQIEVFWDSLLRGIPIGLFSVAYSAGETILLDGQQRWHAIKIAHPNEYGILWCAILSDSAKLNLYNRKYLFRWTTNAHPWGFDWNENEKSAPRLNIYERRKILETNGRQERDLFIKPAVGNIYPFPYGDDGVALVKIQSLLEDDEPPMHFSDSQKKYWRELKSKIEYVVSQPVIPLIGNIPVFGISQRDNAKKTDRAQEIDTEWTETFFLRMNSQGTPFSQNELAYSALKSSLHAIGIESPRRIFEEMANELKIDNAADLAQIVLQLITFSLYDKNFSQTWNAGEIKEFFKDKSSDRDKINDEIMSLKTAAGNLVKLIEGFNARQKKTYILPYLLGQMPSEILRLVLLILKSRRFGETVPENLLSLMFLLWWFCVEDRVNGVREPVRHGAEHIAAEIQKNADSSLEDLFAQCVYKGFHVPPVPPEMLKNVDASYGVDSDPVRNELLELRMGNTFYWDISQNFVLLACGKYLANNFSEMNVSGEDNRPWDYDHFLPKSKVKDDKSILNRLCWSSGNNVPIALTTNRKKHDALPEKNYPDNNEKSQALLYLDLESLDEIFPEGESIDQDKFNSFAWQRYCRMYEEVYTALGWDRFVRATFRDGKSFAGIANALRERINTATGKKYNWYYALDGRDFPILEEDDFGRDQYYILRDSADACYAIETLDFKTFSTYGKRKAAILPVGRGVDWWDDSVKREGLSAEDAINWLMKKAEEEKHRS